MLFGNARFSWRKSSHSGPIPLPVAVEWTFWWLSQWELDETGLVVKVWPACVKSLYSQMLQSSANSRLLKQLLKCTMWKASHKSSDPFLKCFWEMKCFCGSFRPRQKLCLQLRCFIYWMPSTGCLGTARWLLHECSGIFGSVRIILHKNVKSLSF